MTKLSKPVIAVILLGVVIILAVVLHPNKSPIPGAIQQQITSVILVPKGNGYNVDAQTVKYDKSNKLLSFKVKKDGQLVATIAEQPTPDTFTDIPEFSAKFFQQAGEYKAFDTALGTAHLLHPGKGVSDAAAMNAKGTLMFINPIVKMSEDDWRKLLLTITVL